MAKTTRKDWQRRQILLNADEAEYQRDQKLWLEAIFPTALSEGQIDQEDVDKVQGQGGFLLRLFVLLRYGGLQYRKDNKLDNTNTWRNWDKPFAAALSHGGRVIINMAKLGQQRQGGWSWLLMGYPTKVTRGGRVDQNILDSTLLKGRSGSTHGTDVRRMNIKGQSKGELYEKKGIMQNITRGLNPESHLWGMNIALGGFGGENSQGGLITPNGGHGHLHILYRQIYKLLSGPYAAGLLIGCENMEHGAKPGYGPKRDKTHLATGHGAGGKQKVSATNGLKWAALGKKYGESVPAEYNGMRVNVGIDSWAEIRKKYDEIKKLKDAKQRKERVAKILGPEKPMLKRLGARHFPKKPKRY